MQGVVMEVIVKDLSLECLYPVVDSSAMMNVGFGRIDGKYQLFIQSKNGDVYGYYIDWLDRDYISKIASLCSIEFLKSDDRQMLNVSALVLQHAKKNGLSAGVIWGEIRKHMEENGWEANKYGRLNLVQSVMRKQTFGERWRALLAAECAAKVELEIVLFD
jgi:hypothetical protein